MDWVSEWVSEVTQSCPTLSDPMDYSLPGSSIHGIFQARVLEWVAISFSKIRFNWLQIKQEKLISASPSPLRIVYDSNFQPIVGLDKTLGRVFYSTW